ncbi:MAG: esterase-like activity of phytase family protein [Saprospiraceae bacterium]|nr:esterase-like activity of phytase family protein [Saprospiraceae bacterium]
MKKLFLLLLFVGAMVTVLSAQKQLMVQVSAPEDDLEERILTGAMDAGSSDLELGSEERDGSVPQLVGIRFRNVTIPKGAYILSAKIVFQVDATSKNADPCVVSIKTENVDNPAAFATTAFNISTRSASTDSVVWNIPAGSWNTVGANGADQTTPDLKNLIQALVNRSGWASGNAMAFIMRGTGTREAESYDGLPAGAPKLIIDYVESTTTFMAQVSAAEDDLEERLTDGSMDSGSSDLELGSEERDGSVPQLVGVRFRNVTIPKGATILDARIIFQVDATSKNADPSVISIKAQAADNPDAFATTAFNISPRPTSADSVVWNIPAGSWNVVGAAGADQTTPNIANLVQTLVNRSGWTPGNAMAFILRGTGTREAESYDGLPAGAPKLVITLAAPDDEEPVTTVLEGCDDEIAKGDPEELELEVLGTYATGAFDEGAAEIVAYDKLSKRLFSTNALANTVTILDITNPANPTKVTDLDMSTYGGGVNSVAIYNGLVAVAVEANTKTANGSVVFFDNLGNFISQVTVGALPDMLTFTPDGTKVLVANEGEPNDDYSVDPEGSVSIINVAGGAASATVTNINFQSYNNRKVALQNRGIRIFGPNATVAQDLEPEYITVTKDNKFAYVALQENNAFAVIDLTTNALRDILPLGYKNHNSGRPVLNQFFLNELVDLPILGTPTYADSLPPVRLSGFSGLWFSEEESTETSYVFYTVPDRGPNDEPIVPANATPRPVNDLRPYKLPNYQGRIAKFTLNIETGEATLDEQILLTRKDGVTPITGRGNIPGYDEVPVTYAHGTGGTILSVDFENAAAVLSPFTTFSAASTNNWTRNTFGGDAFAEMNGFGADVASDDWLISPRVDLTNYTNAFLSFNSIKGFDGGSLEVLISTNYTGTGDPSVATWTNITSQATLSAGNNVDTPSGNIDITAYLSDSTYIAFRYLSTGTVAGTASRWRIDDVKVTSTAGGPFAKVDYTSNTGVQLNALEYDAYGGDFEGIVIDKDGNFWACDENRPAIYKFQPNGTLIERYVPQGTSLLGTTPQAPGFYGAETLPAVYSKRRGNRGFEAIAYDPDSNLIYAFIQSPIEAPSASVRNATDVLRILAIDAATGMPVKEYVYLLESNTGARFTLDRVDKIGDAVYVGNGQFLVLERDSSLPGQPTGKKYVYRVDLTGATNVLGNPLATNNGTGATLESTGSDGLKAAGIQAVQKTKVLNLPSIGYLPGDKPEGIAALPNGNIAVINDNDFGLAGAGVSDASVLGIIEFCDNYGFDASNTNPNIEIKNWPVLGAFLPDATKAATIGGRTYLISANEGDTRDYDTFSEETRVSSLTLDAKAYPDGAALKVNNNLGRLLTSNTLGDYDGDGDVDQIYSIGARSFSIWDEYGNLVFDSGNEFEKLLAEIDPAHFNSTHTDNNSRKNRSDDKGPEPEAVEVIQKGDTTLALIGLERQGGIMVYNISDPNKPYFVNYFNNRNYAANAMTPEAGDLGVETIVYIPAEDSPTGESLIVTPNEVSGTVTIWGAQFENEGFVLRLIHNNDGESKLEPELVGNRLIGGAAPFKTVVDSLKMQDLPFITLSSGDNFLAGIAFNASLNRAPGLPYYDAIVLDSIGYDAIAIGNHDFDFGPDVLQKMITDFKATTPPYLSANLDFTGEPGLQALVTSGRIAKRTVVDVDGQKIGVVGLIYPQVNTITTLRNVKVDTAIVSIAQQQIDELMGEGVNKIVLITHLQSINNEIELISKLTDVDIVVAGGGDELLTNDSTKNELPGIERFGAYPLVIKDAEKRDVYVVTTPGEYRYVGNLQIKFDEKGRVDAIEKESDVILVADVMPDSGLQASVVDSVSIYADNLDQNVIARTEVDLDGTRAGVRTRETNEGNLVADAFLWLGKREAAGLNLPANARLIGVQNGGGIRNDEIIPANSNITEKKTFDILPFDNKVVVTNVITPTQLKAIMEHSVSNVANVDGRFLQIAGFEIVWDTAGTAGQNRIWRILLDDGTPIVQNYQVVAGAPNVYIVTNNFTADGGDGFTTLATVGTRAIIGGSYQRALYEYLIDGINGVVTAAQYPVGGEGRIRKLKDVNTSVDNFDLNEYNFVAGPNPFKESCTVSYNLKTNSNVVIRLTDVLGREIKTLVAEKQAAGQHNFTLNERNLASGMYYLSVQIDGKTAAMPIVKQ